jgi:hypothetical protein
MCVISPPILTSQEFEKLSYIYDLKNFCSSSQSSRIKDKIDWNLIKLHVGKLKTNKNIITGSDFFQNENYDDYML